MSDFEDFMEHFRCFKRWMEECVRLTSGLIQHIELTALKIKKSSDEGLMGAWGATLPVSELREILDGHFLSSDYPTEFFKHIALFKGLFFGRVDDFNQLYEIANVDHLKPRIFNGQSSVTAYQTILDMSGFLNAKYSTVSRGADCEEVGNAILACYYSLIEYDVLDCSVLDEVKTRFTLEHARAERWVFDNTENIGRLVSLQLPTERVPEIVESVQPDSTVEERKPLVGSEEKAYQSYMLAEKSIGECSDRAAYDWVLENGPSEYAVPPFETWGRYVRAGRQHYGTQKNSTRAGRSGRFADPAH